MNQPANPYAIPSPAWDALLRTIYDRLPHLGHEQADTETILQTFVDHELERYEADDSEFWENMEDNLTTIDQQPQFSEDLLQSAATLASVKGETFENLAVQVQRLHSQLSNLQGVSDTIGRLGAQYKNERDQVIAATGGLMDRLERVEAEVVELQHIKQELAEARQELAMYRKSSDPNNRHN